MLDNSINYKICWNTLNPVYKDMCKFSNNKKLPLFYNMYSISDFTNVYEPAEDSFLLSDTLELEILNKNIIASEDNNSVNLMSVEIGCGSSFISFSFIINLLESTKHIKVNKKLENTENTNYNIKHFCYDINKDCIELTNRISKEIDLDKYIKAKVYNFCDINELIYNIKINKVNTLYFIFNPPYVTTDNDELIKAKLNKNIYASWAGGKEGSEIIFEFANYFKEFIKTKPNVKIVLYILLSSENNLDSIIKLFNSNKWSCLSNERFKNEMLGVFKLEYN